MLQFAVLLCLWTLLPLALHRAAARFGLPAGSAALGLMAACLCLVLIVADPVAVVLPTGGARALHDSYFTTAAADQAIALSFLLLAAAGVALIAGGLLAAGQGRWLARTAALGHWSLHLGAGVLLVRLVAWPTMPRGYLDDPDALRWRELGTAAASIAGFLGLVLLSAALLLAVVAAVRQALRRAA